MKRSIKAFETAFKCGVATHFPCKLNDNASEADNMYIIKMCVPDITKTGIEYVYSLHAFTEKELNRACLRYYGECDKVINHLYSADSKASFSKSMYGFITPLTYENDTGALTTRFIIKFDGAKVVGIESPCSLGLFTARELKRSKDRIEWYLNSIAHPILMTFKTWWGRMFHAKGND